MSRRSGANNFIIIKCHITMIRQQVVKPRHIDFEDEKLKMIGCRVSVLH